MGAAGEISSRTPRSVKSGQDGENTVTEASGKVDITINIGQHIHVQYVFGFCRIVELSL